MNLVFLGNRDIASNLAFNYLLRDNPGHEVHVFLSDQVGRKNAPPPPKDLQDLKFFEQDLFNRCLFPLLEATPKAGRRFLTFDEMGARSLNRINTERSASMLRELEPDLIVSIRYGKRIKNQIISIPRHGILNLHSGILPDYRGVLATFRALLAGEEEIGCTLHVITDAEIDTGNIIANSRLPVDPSKSLFWHVLRLYAGGCALVTDALRNIEQGERLVSTPQDPEAGEYFSFPTEEDLHRFRETGWDIFHGEEIFELIGQFTTSVGPDLQKKSAP